MPLLQWDVKCIFLYVELSDMWILREISIFPVPSVQWRPTVLILTFDMWHFAECSRLQLQCRLCFILLLDPCTTSIKLCLLTVDACMWQWLVMTVAFHYTFEDWRETLPLWCPFLRVCNLFALAALGIPCLLGGQEVWVCILLNGCLLPILPGTTHWGLCTDDLMMVTCPSCQLMLGQLFTRCC